MMEPIERKAVDPPRQEQEPLSAGLIEGLIDMSNPRRTGEAFCGFCRQNFTVPGILGPDAPESAKYEHLHGVSQEMLGFLQALRTLSCEIERQGHAPVDLSSGAPQPAPWLAELQQPILQYMLDAWTRYERALRLCVGGVEDASQPSGLSAAPEYSQLKRLERRIKKEGTIEKVRDLLREAPFPGYAIDRDRANLVVGTYHMVNMIFDSPLAGCTNTFQAVVNTFHHDDIAVRAHVERINLLQDIIAQEIDAFVSAHPDPAERFKLLVVACGPAREAYGVFSHEHADRVDVTLTDADAGARAHAHREMERARAEAEQRLGPDGTPHGPVLTRLYIPGENAMPSDAPAHKEILNVLQLIDAGVQELHRDQHLVLCAGLADYLPDVALPGIDKPPMMHALTGLLFDRLQEGGLLVLTNVADNNPYELTRTTLFGWRLFVRSAARLEGWRSVAPQDELSHEPEAYPAATQEPDSAIRDEIGNSIEPRGINRLLYLRRRSPDSPSA